MSIQRLSPADSPEYSEVSHVVRAGHFVFIAGQIGAERSGTPPTDIRDQIARVYANLEIACRAVGLTLADIVKTTTFIKDASYYPAIVEARKATYGDDPPANSTIIVASLAEPEWLVEIEAVAYAGED